MTGGSGLTSKIAAGVLVTVNLIVMVICTLLFGLSLWMISSPSSLSTTIQEFGTPVLKTLLSPDTLSVQLGVATAVLTGFIACVAFMGLYGAFSRSPFLLFMYAALVLLLLLLECALTFYFSSSLKEKGLLEQDGQWTHALRLAFRCCEFNSTLQSPEVIKLPWSCCGTEGYPSNCTFPKIYPLNCNETIPRWLNRYITAIYASLAALHILLLSCSLVRRTRLPSHKHS